MTNEVCGNAPTSDSLLLLLLCSTSHPAFEIRHRSLSMKLALHRSIAFWSGLLVLAFLAWAWVYSLNRMAYAGRDQWVVGVQPSRVLLQWYDGGKGTPPNLEVIELNEGLPVVLFPPALCSVHYPSGVAIRLLYVPFWMLVIAAGLPWAGLLVLRARRRKGKLIEP